MRFKVTSIQVAGTDGAGADLYSASLIQQPEEGAPATPPGVPPSGITIVIENAQAVEVGALYDMTLTPVAQP